MSQSQDRTNWLIEQLLSEAQFAVREGNWQAVRQRAEAALEVEPDNATAMAYLTAAQTVLADQTSSEGQPVYTYGPPAMVRVGTGDLFASAYLAIRRNIVEIGVGKVVFTGLIMAAMLGTIVVLAVAARGDDTVPAPAFTPIFPPTSSNVFESTPVVDPTMPPAPTAAPTAPPLPTATPTALPVPTATPTIAPTPRPFPTVTLTPSPTPKTLPTSCQPELGSVPIPASSATALSLTLEGVSQANLGSFQLAIDLLTQALTIDRFYYEAYNNRGMAKTNLGQYLRAINDFDCAINLSPTIAKGYANRAVAYRLQMEFSKASVDFSRAVNAGFQSSALTSEFQLADLQGPQYRTTWFGIG